MKSPQYDMIFFFFFFVVCFNRVCLVCKKELEWISVFKTIYGGIKKAYTYWFNFRVENPTMHIPSKFKQNTYFN